VLELTPPHHQMGFGFTNLPLSTQGSKRQKTENTEAFKAMLAKRIRSLNRKGGSKIQQKVKIEIEMGEERKRAVGEGSAA